jgi:hypothetical protein
VFPADRTNYYTDDNGPVDWDYAEPCNTWANLKEMYADNKCTLVFQRGDMYDQLIKKLKGFTSNREPVIYSLNCKMGIGSLFYSDSAKNSYHH